MLTIIIIMTREFPRSGKLHHRRQLLHLPWNLPSPGQRVGVDTRWIFLVHVYELSLCFIPHPGLASQPPLIPQSIFYPAARDSPVGWAFFGPYSIFHCPQIGSTGLTLGPGALRPGLHPLWAQLWHTICAGKAECTKVTQPKPSSGTQYLTTNLQGCHRRHSCPGFNHCPTCPSLFSPTSSIICTLSPHSPWFPPTSLHASLKISTMLLPFIPEPFFPAEASWSPIRPIGSCSDGLGFRVTQT